MPENNILKIINITKFYGYGLLGLKKFKAVDDVSFTLNLSSPSIFVLAGETGSGKTTLLRIIMGIIQPDSGQVIYRGFNVHKIRGKISKQFRREVQPVFQDPYEAFNPLRKVESYLFNVGTKLLGMEKKEIEEEIDKVLRYVGLSLDKIKGKYPKELSGGELQRVSLARALLVRPKLLLADEPVSMIDASLRVNILNILKSIKQDYGTTIIYVTHDLSTAYYIGDEIGIMYRGSLIEIGSIKEVYSNPLHPYTQQLFDSLLEPDPYIEKKVKIPQIVVTELREFLAIGCKYYYRCPYATNQCKEKPPPMIVIGKSAVKCWLYSKK